MSLPMYIGAAETAHNVVAVRRSSRVRPSMAPLPTSSESRSFQPPLPPLRHQVDRSGKSRAMFCHWVSASCAQ